MKKASLNLSYSEIFNSQKKMSDNNPTLQVLNETNKIKVNHTTPRIVSDNVSDANFSANTKSPTKSPQA